MGKRIEGVLFVGGPLHGKCELLPVHSEGFKIKIPIPDHDSEAGIKFRVYTKILLQFMKRFWPVYHLVGMDHEQVIVLVCNIIFTKVFSPDPDPEDRGI